MELGLRVVRGPDWKWADQDAGEGHVGTVVEIGKVNSQTIPYKTVVIQWDSGSRSNYRVGYQNAYDLRVFDNAPCGSFHPNTRCQSCNCDSIIGMRWQCSLCPNYDLCTSCYMSGYHCAEHPFIRYDTAESPGAELPPRFFNNTIRIEARGIFKGARVVRGHDWDWENQDGGQGKVGEVIEIRGWDKSSRRSVASVRWQKNNANVYRVGHKGKVDLKCVFDASGGYYFRDHLPILGQMANRLDQKQSETSTENTMPEASSISSHLSQRISSASVMMPETSSLFSIGDRVQVIAVDENILKEMQRGHGGWNPRMAQVIGWVGTVHRITDNQDVRVQFENSNRWTFNPKALGKFTRYALGETVQLLDDEEQVRRLQKNHGEWIDYMRPSLGKIGKITKIYTDGDLRVAVDGKTWTLNPLSVKRPNAELSNDSAMKETKNQDRMQWGLSSSMTPKGYQRNLRKSKSNKSGTAELNQSGCSSSENNNQVNTDVNINESIDIALQSKGISQDAKCLICDDNIANLLFFPCLHQVCCSECSFRLKKCFDCKKAIQKLIFIDPLSSEVLNVVDEWPVYSPVSSGSTLPSTHHSNEDSNLEPINNLHEDVHERLKFLETKIMEIEEANSCGICLEKPKTIIFLCGHGACIDCANTLTTCHMCRKTILRKINIY